MTLLHSFAHTDPVHYLLRPLDLRRAVAWRTEAAQFRSLTANLGHRFIAHSQIGILLRETPDLRPRPRFLPPLIRLRSLSHKGVLTVAQATRCLLWSTSGCACLSPRYPWKGSRLSAL